RSPCPLRDPQVLMRLQAQLPLRMGQAVLDGETGVLLALGPVHRLEQQVGEAEFLEQLRGRSLLRKYKLEIVAASQFQRCARLRADADPVQPRGSVLGAVGLDGYLEPGRMQGLDGGLVQLQQRFAAGADYVRARPYVIRAVPCGRDRRRQVRSGSETPAARTVRADEVG